MALWVGPQVIGLLPGLAWFGNWYFDLLPRVATWTGGNLLRITVPPIPNHASGDQVADWIQAGMLVGVSLVAALTWAGFSRASRRRDVAAEVARVLLRYGLATIMLRYGLAKVLHRQMAEPDAYRLLETYGQSSPMGLLWTFIGQSAAYSFYTGGLEVIGGALLFFRRTTTVGALLVTAITFNILVLNLCYDVPVKLYSATLFILSVALAAPGICRIWRLLILHRATDAAAVQAPLAWLRQGAGRRIHWAGKALLLAWILWMGPATQIIAGIRAAPGASALDGIYHVTSFEAKGLVRPPLETDALRWNWVGIDHGKTFFVQSMVGERGSYRLRQVPPDKLELLAFRHKGKPMATLTYELKGDELTLSGTLPVTGPVIVHLHRDDSRRLLMTRGFHWVSQFPFNQ